MCIVSMVIDRFEPLLPEPSAGTWPWLPQVDLSELRKLIDDFREAFAAAKTVDRLTGQPDCEDSEKAKLLDRVAFLESHLEIYRLREENAALREKLRSAQAQDDGREKP